MQYIEHQYVAIPNNYFQGLPDCVWSGDETYQGLVEHSLTQQLCIEFYQQRLEDIKAWDQKQAAIGQEYSKPTK